MTTSRLAILLTVLLAGMSSFFLLPKQHTFDQPMGIELALPKMVGGIWYGRDVEVSEKEHGGLGPETEFARKSYTDARGDEIQASIVLAGRDMNTSIHRPEWCLPAQGWTIENSSKVAIALKDRGTLHVTRLANMRFIQDPKTGKPLLDKDGQQILIRNLDYYWFVGSTDATETHFSRNVIDWRDRLFKNYNQRWAFVTVATNITENLQTNGLTEAQTDEMIQEFIKKLVPVTHKDSVKFH
jgi:EpsI family protein